MSCPNPPQPQGLIKAWHYSNARGSYRRDSPRNASLQRTRTSEQCPLTTNGMALTAQEKIKQIDAKIRDLNAQRNALVPISRLPAEILSRIFHEVRYATQEGSRRSLDDNKDRLKWIPVSHVSRHWRNVAINDPTLWTHLPLMNPKWTTIMLDRSRTAAISAIWLGARLDEKVATALMPHITRVSSLGILKTKSGTLKQILSALPSTAPDMESLWINCPHQVQSHEWLSAAALSSHDEAVTFPDDVLRHTPKLQHLGLNDVIIKSDSPLLSSLTTLSLGGLPEKSKPTPHEFETMLESAPRLKRLALVRVCPPSGSNQQKKRTLPVQMQHLEYLFIDETIPRLVYVFSVLSATCVLKALTIDGDYTEGSALDVSPLFAALDQPYIYSVIGSSTDVRRLRVRNSNGERIIIEASKISMSERNLEPSKRKNPDHTDTMTIGIDTESDEDQVESMNNGFILNIFNNFTWTGLSELDLSELHSASPQVLASTFGTIPTLRILMIDAEVAPSVFKAMNYSLDRAQSSAANATSLPFPGLQHIYTGTTRLAETTSNFTTLRKYLKRRHECGIPIISLNLSRSPLTKQAIWLLKKYVEHLILKPSESNEVINAFSPYNYDWYI